MLDFAHTYTDVAITVYTVCVHDSCRANNCHWRPTVCSLQPVGQFGYVDGGCDISYHTMCSCFISISFDFFYISKSGQNSVRKRSSSPEDSHGVLSALYIWP